MSDQPKDGPGCMGGLAIMMWIFIVVTTITWILTRIENIEHKLSITPEPLKDLIWNGLMK